MENSSNTSLNIHNWLKVEDIDHSCQKMSMFTNWIQGVICIVNPLRCSTTPSSRLEFHPSLPSISCRTCSLIWLLRISLITISNQTLSDHNILLSILLLFCNQYWRQEYLWKNYSFLWSKILKISTIEVQRFTVYRLNHTYTNTHNI